MSFLPLLLEKPYDQLFCKCNHLSFFGLEDDGKGAKWNFSEERIAEFKEAFRMTDKDGSGKISKVELGKAMRLSNLNPTDAELEEIIFNNDANGDGELDFSEYLDIMGGIVKDISEEEEIRLAFKIFDKEGNGKISRKTLRYILKSCGQHFSEDDVADLLDEFDVNKDGFLDIEEFVLLMTAKEPVQSK